MRDAHLRRPHRVPGRPARDGEVVRGRHIDPRLDRPRADRRPERRVFGLALSQNATDVLTGNGLTARNTAAWLATQNRLTAGHATTTSSGSGCARPTSS